MFAVAADSLDLAQAAVIYDHNIFCRPTTRTLPALPRTPTSIIMLWFTGFSEESRAHENVLHPSRSQSFAFRPLIIPHLRSSSRTKEPSLSVTFWPEQLRTLLPKNTRNTLRGTVILPTTLLPRSSCKPPSANYLRDHTVLNYVDLSL